MTARVLLVASHRRSGTHWMLDSLRTNALDVNPRFLTLERIQPSHPSHEPLAAWDRRLRSMTGLVLVKTHAFPGSDAWERPDARDYAERLFRESRSIYVYRDGRDVLVSLYYYVTSFAPEVANIPFATFLRAEYESGEGAGLNRAALWQRHALSWLSLPPTAQVAYEALQSDYAGTMAGLSRDLGLEMRPSLSDIALEPRAGVGPLARLRRRLPGAGRQFSSAISPRTGTSGAWRSHFDDADTAWFREQAHDAMERLGYA